MNPICSLRACKYCFRLVFEKFIEIIFIYPSLILESFIPNSHDDTNTEKLRMATREGGSETDVFYFDPKCVIWEDYFMNIHIPGLVKYIFK